MKTLYNEFLENLKPYKLASHEVWETADKDQVLKLDWNEGTCPPSPLVFENLHQLLLDGYFHWYPDNKMKNLISALANYNDVLEENIQYFFGSDSVHEYVVKTYLKKGDKVLILGPTYDNFRLTAESMGTDIFYSLFSPDFKFYPNEFKKDIQRHAPSFVYICNPNNPTGYLHSIEYIQSLISEFPETMFLIDEAYFEFSGISAKDLSVKHQNIIISRSFSKAFCLAGFRIGYLIGSKKNIEIVSKIRNPKSFNVFSQNAALSALKDLKYTKKYIENVLLAKNYLSKELSSMTTKGFAEVINSHGNYLLVRIISENRKDEIVEYLRQNKIYVRTFAHSALLINCLRITIGTIEQMEYLLNILNNE